MIGPRLSRWMKGTRKTLLLRNIPTTKISHSGYALHPDSAREIFEVDCISHEIRAAQFPHIGTGHGNSNQQEKAGKHRTKLRYLETNEGKRSDEGLQYICRASEGGATKPVELLRSKPLQT
ncbi:hypothetical protein TWF718_007074 [Orbilia javanica]|uniref:Uncharacterized protein n=1 Tax=Orbilia javanica TaxID=47235 RepID=A0AAN8RI34_9PEZI